MGSKSQTTIDSLDELRTPATNTSEFISFGLPPVEEPKQMTKAVEGPVGPHLFRMSQEHAQDVDIYLTLSPAASPEEVRPKSHFGRESYKEPPRTSIPLRIWSRQQVAEWMFSTGFDRSICDTFFINDISGVTLIDLKYEDLKELGITSFGQRHKLWTEIKALKDAKLPPPEEDPFVPTESHNYPRPEPVTRECSPESPGEELLSPISPSRRGRRHMQNDLISPAESASIVAIEQLLPKSHSCSKGDDCKTRQKYLKKMARIRAEFPHEIRQLEAQHHDVNGNSPVESGLGASIVASIQSSIVASSDALTGGLRPKLRLEEISLKTIRTRDPQESVRQFLNFQHAMPSQDTPTTPPYEMFPPLSPPATSAPHSGLVKLPKLYIPAEANKRVSSADRTALPPPRRQTPITALNLTQHPRYNEIYRMDSPASEFDVPVTAFPIGPIQRDFSSSVPPDMRFGGRDGVETSNSRMEHRVTNNFSQPFSPIQRSNSTATHRQRGSSFAYEQQQAFLRVSGAPSADAASVLTAPTEFDVDDLTPTETNCPELTAQQAGWMKKRRTKMLRHEWNEHHFRLNGTQLAMHKDEKGLDALEYIDVDDYAVAISANNSKINAAFKRLHISGGKGKGLEPGAFAFQLTPASDKKGIMHAATGKTHHFAVKSQNERIDWMRELMLARAKKQKDAVCANF